MRVPAPALFYQPDGTIVSTIHPQLNEGLVFGVTVHVSMSGLLGQPTSLMRLLCSHAHRQVDD